MGAGTQRYPQPERAADLGQHGRLQQPSDNPEVDQYAGKREDKFAKVHICQCEFVASAGLAGRQRTMECAAGAGLKRPKVRGFRRGGGMIMLRRLRAVQGLSRGPARNFQGAVTLRKQSEAHLLNRTDRPAPMPGEAGSTD